MQTWDAITSRRNVRSFSGQPVSAEHLDHILEAARRAPSSRNTQPWDFLLVTDRVMLTDLATVWVGAGHGIGSCHSGVGDGDLAGRLLRLPEDRTCAFLISLGYPAGRPLAPISNPDRRPFDDVVHRGTW